MREVMVGRGKGRVNGNELLRQSLLLPEEDPTIYRLCRAYAVPIPCLSRAPQDKRGILAAESDAVANSMLDHCAATGLRNIVQIADGIRGVEVESRGNLSSLH